MSAIEDADQFVRQLMRVDDLTALTSALGDLAEDLGFPHVTLVHHVDHTKPPARSIGFSNYPPGWLELSLGRRYFAQDPVLTACQGRIAPFTWSQLPELLDLDSSQKEILAEARKFGLNEGLTVPINVPGEHPGSCSFASGSNRPLMAEVSVAAHWAAVFAFDRAREIIGLRSQRARRPRLTQRQLDCVQLACRGKSDWVIAQLLGISHHTVHQHIEAAKRRYEVSSREQLVTACLADGVFALTDLLG